MRIGIVGGGISGMAAAYLLARRHEVRLFEAAPRLGGHTYTLDVGEGERSLAIDLGFIVFNERTYPGFCRFLEELGVESRESTMSFSVRSEATGLEYNGTTLNTLFAQRSNLFRPSFHRMIAGILRFHRVAPALLESDGDPTLGEYLEAQRFSGPFVDHYLVPMTAAVWSTEPRRALDFPARTFVQFLANHGMLTVNDRPVWRTVRGGSRTYVDALAEYLGDRVSTATPVARVRRFPDRVEVRAENGEAIEFDQVILATHGPQALGLLADPSAAERQILEAIPYAESEVVLHTDERLLPRRPLARASWNYHLDDPRDGQPDPPSGPQVTYSMNRLQGLETEREYMVTLNRTARIDPETILHRVAFAHPQFTRAGVAAQKRWGEINGVDRTWFCGAYWGYGFHEDGLRSAVRVARALGVEW